MSDAVDTVADGSQLLYGTSEMNQRGGSERDQVAEFFSRWGSVVTLLVTLLGGGVMGGKILAQMNSLEKRVEQLERAVSEQQKATTVLETGRITELILSVGEMKASVRSLKAEVDDLKGYHRGRR